MLCLRFHVLFLKKTANPILNIIINTGSGDCFVSFAGGVFSSVSDVCKVASGMAADFFNSASGLSK